jgi:hypothetical protein
MSRGCWWVVLSLCWAAAHLQMVLDNTSGGYAKASS